MSKLSAEERALLKQTLVEQVIADTPVAIRLKYTGTGTITSVVVTNTTSVVLTTSDATLTFLFSAYATLGALVDAINAYSYWDAKILDGLRADSTQDSSLKSATVAISNGYYDLVVDTSTAKTLTYRVTGSREVSANRSKGHRVALIGASYYATLGAAALGGFRVYEWDPIKKTETLKYQRLSVSATTTDVTFASGNAKMGAGWGNDLIVRLIDGSSLSDTNAYLEAHFERE